jgi:hypothetical protein
MRTSERTSSLLWAAAVLGPVLVAGLLSLGRGKSGGGPISATNAALVLVVVVIAVALTGNRWAGSVAAVVAGAAFDFFWTSPYLKLAIDDPADIQTAALLVVAGVVVSQLAWWNRLHKAEATARSGYLDRVQQGIFGSGDDAAEPPALHRYAVEQAVASLLDADACTFRTTPARSATVLHPDGTVTDRGVALDVARFGLPTDVELVIRTPQPDLPGAHLEVVAAGHVARPEVAQRQAAVILAVGAAQRVLAVV